MRPGQGQRRGGRRNENRHGGHGGHGGGQHRSGQNGQGAQGQNRSAQSLRNQIFDSNGPDMRVRGNAFQVHEKYQALAKDALSSGDRVLAENYLQHAEHYFRIIEAINEATAAEQRARQASWESQPQPQPVQYTDGAQPEQGNQDQAQDGNAQPQDGSYPQGQQQNGQQFQRRRDNNREGGRDQNYQSRQQRYENRNNDARGNYSDNQGYGNPQNQGQADYQPHSQSQQQGGQSQDPLYDGVDEDNGSPDAQAAIGGRR